MEKKFCVLNTSRAAAAWAASPVGLLLFGEVLVTVSCALLVTLVFLGSGWRTSRRSALHFFVWLALMLCFPAVSYTIGLIQSGSFRNDLAVVWACFLLGCTDSVFACSLDDSYQKACTTLNQATQVIYVLLLLVSYVSSLGLQLQILLLLLCVLSIAKLGMRLPNLTSARRNRVLTTDNWLISKYMAHEYVRSIWDFDPDTMTGYKYVVAGEKDVLDGHAGYTLEVTDDLVTVDRVWHHEGRGSLLSKDSHFSSKLKDLCLSFALFKLLRRRLSGNPLHERDDIRTLVFVRRGLAGGDSSNDFERMFRVIEVELGFLFDFFYARYPPTKQSLIPKTTIFVVAMALGLSTLFSPALLHYHNPQAGNESFVTTSIDIWLTRCIIVLFLILELFQYLSALSLVLSDWYKVKILCWYVRTPSWQGHPIFERLVWLMCRATLTTQYWSNSVGQYSLLHACLSEGSSLARIPLYTWFKGLLIQTRTATHRNLPDTVKRAIHLLLRSEWLSNLKYGDHTLQRNDMLHDFDWSTSRYQYGAVGSILVWHIATTICTAKQSQKLDGTTGAVADNHEVATTISNYCAYLLFQAPELVTEHTYDAQRLMEALQLRVQKFLKHNVCRSKDDMFKKLPEFQRHEQESAYEETILADGIKLSHQIFDEINDEAVRWKVLSEMWVELLLSVSPLDNVMAHVKKLATGGELITHLWALLTHGGIINRPRKPNYMNHQIKVPVNEESA